MENEQIEVILKQEGISAAQLAERLDIQRSQVSHLMNNRNRVSLDIVKKIHHAFPHISLTWLMDHEGDYANPGFARTSPSTLFNDPPEETAATDATPNDNRQSVGVGPEATGEKNIDNEKNVGDTMSVHEPVAMMVTPIDIPISGADTNAPSASGPSTTGYRASENPKNPSNGPIPPDFCSHGEPARPIDAPYGTDRQAFYLHPSGSRKITEIVVFYDDGTFETFRKVERKPLT